MPGRHHPPRARLRWLIGALLATLLSVGVVLGFSSTASASTTVKAQLSLSGVATADSPTGGSVVGIHPGDSVSFTTASVPTAGLDKLGLGGLVGSLLNGVLGFQSVANFSGLPGGKAGTVVSTSKAVTFTFPSAGTYNFTWTVEKLTLLGAVPINLDGNQLASAGIKLNASNQYVGKIVVATNPPQGGITLQLPGVSVAPNIGGVQLPTIGVPGVQAPTLHATVPNLTQPGSGGSKSGGSTKTGSSGGSSNGRGEVPIPALVVPRGDNAAVFGGSVGGAFPGVLGLSNDQAGAAANSGASNTAASAANPSAQATQRSTGKHKTIDLASNKASTGQLSVVLAIVAVIALTLVAATYARLYILRKP